MHFEIQDINLLWTNPSVHCKLCCDWFNKADWLVARQGQVKRENQTKDTGKRGAELRSESQARYKRKQDVWKIK